MSQGLGDIPNPQDTEYLDPDGRNSDNLEGYEDRIETHGERDELLNASYRTDYEDLPSPRIRHFVNFPEAERQYLYQDYSSQEGDGVQRDPIYTKPKPAVPSDPSVRTETAQSTLNPKRSQQDLYFGGFRRTADSQHSIRDETSQGGSSCTYQQLGKNIFN